jgi:hypothetical protein
MRAAPDAAMVTLTRSHSFSPLMDDWNATESVLRRFTDRGSWSRFKKLHGIDGYARAVEVTHSASGWNVHLHMLLTFSRKLTPDAETSLTKEIKTRWCAAAAFAGQIAAVGNQTVRICRTQKDREDAAVYITKQHLLHLAPDWKKSSYPADLLAGAFDGDVDDCLNYREYLTAAKGRTQIRALGRLSSTTRSKVA